MSRSTACVHAIFLRDSSGRAALEPALPTYTMTARRASGGMAVHLLPSGILFHVHIRTRSCARFWRSQRVCRGLRGRRLRQFWTQSSSTVRAYVISEISRGDNHVMILINVEILPAPNLALTRTPVQPGHGFGALVGLFDRKSLIFPPSRNWARCPK